MFWQNRFVKKHDLIKPNNKLFGILREIYEVGLPNQGGIGFAPERWAQQVLGQVNDYGLERRQISRDDIFFRRSKVKSCEELKLLVIAICAWGGMRHGNARTAFSNYNNGWSAICEAVFQGNLSKGEAYEKFRERFVSRSLVGIGAAYFTKLIYFLSPEHDGYIMDQWTARSINALFLKPGGKIVDLNSQNLVDTRANDRASYEEFCSCMDKGARLLHIDDTGRFEQLIFSHGGKRPGRWRKLIKDKLY